MIYRLALVACFCVAAVSASAGDFSEGSTAKKYRLKDEEKARFSGKVVDILCELTGQCAENCGNGNRVLGIVRDADKKLVLVLKNAQFSFNGPVEDLLPYCNKAVDVDGLLIADPEAKGAKFYMVQKIKEAGAQEWTKANRWTKAWAEKHPQAKGEGPWFRRDPRIKKQIAATGYFGLGEAVDEAYRKENQ